MRGYKRGEQEFIIHYCWNQESDALFARIYDTICMILMDAFGMQSKQHICNGGRGEV